MKKLICVLLPLVLLLSLWACGQQPEEPDVTEVPTQPIQTEEPTAEAEPTPTEPEVTEPPTEPAPTTMMLIPEDAVLLTEEELAQINTELFSYNEEEGTLPFTNLFLLSFYGVPEEVNLFEVFRGGYGDRSLSSAERSALKKLGEMVDLDAGKTTSKDMSKVLEQYMGITLKQSKKVDLSTFRYLKKYDAYYFFAGDTNISEHTMLEGYRTADGKIVLLHKIDEYSELEYNGKYGLVTLKTTDVGEYQFVSHLPCNRQGTPTKIYYAKNGDKYDIRGYDAAELSWQPDHRPNTAEDGENTLYFADPVFCGGYFETNPMEGTLKIDPEDGNILRLSFKADGKKGTAAVDLAAGALLQADQTVIPEEELLSLVLQLAKVIDGAEAYWDRIT